MDSHYHESFKKYHQLSLSILKEFGFGQSVMEFRVSMEVEDLIKDFRNLNGQPVYPKEIVSACVLSVISSIVIGDRMKDVEVNQRLRTLVDDVFKYARQAILIDNIHSLRYLPKYKNLVNKVGFCNL